MPRLYVADTPDDDFLRAIFLSLSSIRVPWLCVYKMLSSRAVAQLKVVGVERAASTCQQVWRQAAQIRRSSVHCCIKRPRLSVCFLSIDFPVDHHGLESPPSVRLRKRFSKKSRYLPISHQRRVGSESLIIPRRFSPFATRVVATV